MTERSCKIKNRLSSFPKQWTKLEIVDLLLARFLCRPNKPLTWPTTLLVADLRSLFLDAGLARRSFAHLAF